MPTKNELRVEDNKILYFNGVKWLIKETCSNNAEALLRLSELQNG